MNRTSLEKLDLDVYSETLDNGLRVFVIPKNNNICDLNNLITYCKECHYKMHGYNLKADNKSCELLED